MPMDDNKHVNDVSQDELPISVVERLVTYEEARAHGECAAVAPTGDIRNCDDLACVDLLHRVWADSEPPATPDESTPPRILGDFRLLRELGRGGMGRVFEAEQISMGRRVALKVLPFAALVQEKSLQRFRNEVRAAAALDHPNIVSVYSIGEERGVHFYAMQLIRGQTLADLITELKKESSCREPSGKGPARLAGPTGGGDAQALISTAVDSRRGAESYRAAARLGIQAAEALQHAHDQGVLHRDIKPSNLMLDREGKLFVTDFGLARIEADAGMTMTGDLLGTLRYMAPEQALAKRVVVDHRADIYSLGATLYELLTLQPAFGETDRSELLKQIAFTEPRPLRKIDSRVPVELETIVLKAMAKSTDERYQSAQQLADDLRAFLEDRPIKARPPTLLNRTAKWSRRHRAIASVASVSAILMLMLVSGVVADRRRQVRDANSFVETSLQAARTAFGAGDIEQASLRLAEGKSRIDGNPKVSSPLQEDVRSLIAEAERYKKFLPLLQSARDSRSEEVINIAPAHEALALYELPSKEDRLTTLKALNLPRSYVEHLSEDIYTLLLLSADHLLRWPADLPELTRDSREPTQCDAALKRLDLALKFHEPSRGYYWLLANAALIQGDKAREQELREMAFKTSAQDASELFYIIRDRTWGTVSSNRGYPEYSIDEMIRDHLETLRLDPTYYNGMFFTAVRLGEQKRHQEALLAWYACTSMRQDDSVALVNRGSAHLELGQVKEAKADYERALVMSSNSASVKGAIAYIFSVDPHDEIRDGKRAVQLAAKACELSEYKRDKHLLALAAAYAETGDFDSAMKWAEAAKKLAKNWSAEDAKKLESFRQKQPWRE